MAEELALWLEFADADLETARFLYERQHPRQLEIICYHCQQAAEKAVKALYISLDIPGGIPRKHDLGFLLNQLTGRMDIPEAIFDAAEDLQPYGVIVRYPNENRVDDYNTQRALRHARAIVEWVKGAIAA